MKIKLPTKSDFPIFKNNRYRGRPLVYLDSAATSQKPQIVIDTQADWYKKHNANIHRGLYPLAEDATRRFEQTRKAVARFINAQTPRNIVFTKSATEGINAVAAAWAKKNLKAGDEILVTAMEHHANLLPWLVLSQERGLKLRYWPITPDGRLDLKAKNLFRAKTKLIACTYISNVLGTINPVQTIIKQAKRHHSAILIDAAQVPAHYPLNIKKLDPDFLVFSGHKMFGPTGIGIVYIAPKHFKEFGLYQTGGDMVTQVSRQAAEFKPLPWRLEAGTQPLAEIAGLKAAMNYIKKLGYPTIQSHLKNLTKYAYQKLTTVPDLIIYGPPPSQRSAIITFNLKKIHSHDVAGWLAQKNIAVRAGHHCAQPLHQNLGVAATVRVSLSIYNSKADIDQLIKALKKLTKIWRNSTAKK